METKQKFPVGKIVKHNDPMMGMEHVKILGFYEFTTMDQPSYLVKFLDDETPTDTWLCTESDLSE